MVGDVLGSFDGKRVGKFVDGSFVGGKLGDIEGCALSWTDGLLLGFVVGIE